MSKPANTDVTKSFLGLNRAQMEQERLARLKRASPNDSEDHDERVAKVGRIGVRDVNRSKTSAQLESTTQASKKQPMRQTIHTLDSYSIGGHNPSSGSVTKSGIQFLEGTLRKTFVEGAPRSSDDIKLEEILQRVCNTRQLPCLITYSFVGYVENGCLECVSMGFCMVI